MLRIQKNKYRFIVATLALLVGALPFTAVYGQSDQLQSARQNVAQSANKITAADDLPVRQTALIKIFDLTLAEIADVSSKDKLGFNIELNKQLADLRDNHMATLIHFDRFINLLKQQLASSQLSSDSLKKMAEYFKAWHTTVYQPRTKEIFNFLLLIQARNVLATATARFNKITLDLTKLELIASKSDSRTLTNLLGNAQKNLETARRYQDQTTTLVTDPKNLPQTPEVVPVSLRQSIGGVFNCTPIPGAGFSDCAFTFRQADGNYIMLELSPELRGRYSGRDIYQGSGMLVATADAYVPGAAVGAIILTEVNQAEAPAASLITVTPEKIPELSETPTEAKEPLQVLAQKEFAEIAQAYRKFFSMRAIAGKY